jgi:hypothetical protein
MAESFGARLRQQRERQRVPLTAIADETKISLSLLEGLERDDVSHWPAGVFRRSFVRSYARMIGLEADAVVREFVERYPEPAEDSVPSVPPAVRESTGAPPTRLRCLVASAIESLGRRRQELRRRDGVGEAPPADRPAVLTPETTPVAPMEDLAPAVVAPASPWEPDLSAVAHLCTDLGRVLETREVGRLLEGATSILDAAGLIVWVWDPHATALKPALAHGYSSDLLAKLPRVRRDADNATAASFRSAQTRIVQGNERANGAVVVPLMTPAGCGGVFAVELRNGGEQKESVRALATIFAAQIAAFVASATFPKAVSA